MPSVTVMVRVMGGGAGADGVAVVRARRYCERRPPGRWWGRGGGR